MGHFEAQVKTTRRSRARGQADLVWPVEALNRFVLPPSFLRRRESSAGKEPYSLAYIVSESLTSRERQTGSEPSGGDAQSMPDVPVDDQLAADVLAFAEDRDLEEIVDSALRNWLAQRRAAAMLQGMDESAGATTEDELEEGRRAWHGGE